MDRIRVITAGGVMMAVLAMIATGCGRATMAGASPTAHAPASGSPVAVTAATATEADVYVQVLRRYLSTPAENSFPGKAFTTAYVLDHAYPDAADPNGGQARGTPIAPQTQRRVIAALAGLAQVTFVADRESVMTVNGGCGQVRNGGILVTLSPQVADGQEMRVGINGFVACLGATWLTYVLHDQPGVGWRLTGTTGSMAVS